MRSTWAVVLVHGVGDTNPGATLAAFLPPFLRERRTLEESASPQNRLLVEEDQPKLPPEHAIEPPVPSGETLRDTSARFPMHLRTFSNATPGEPSQAAFAEVFWADLSRAGESRWDVLWRAIGLVFDLRHVADVAAADRGMWLARALRVILYAVSWLLCGPIAGVTVFVAALLFGRYVATSAYERVVQPDVPPLLGEWSVLAFGLVVALAMIPLSRWRKRSSRVPDGAWVLFTSCVAAAGLISVLIAVDRISKAAYFWETGFGKWLLVHLRIGPGALVDATAAHSAVLLGLGYLAFAFLAVAAAAGFVVWVVARSGLLPGKKAGPELDAALGASLLQVMLWVIIGTALGALVLFQLPPPYRDALKEVLIGLMLKLFVALLVGVCALEVLRQRRSWVKADREKRAARGDIPRLVVNPLIMCALILLTLASVTIFAWVFLTGSFFLERWLLRYAEYAKWLILGFAAALGVPFVLKGVRDVLHVLIDITSHFFRPRLNPLETRVDPEKFEIQQRIEARLRRVLQEVLKLENVTHLTVVAHSQGTMIALDVLWLKWANNLLKGKTVSLVTMGSPFSHLYQHYFPHRYPPLFLDGGLNPAWGKELTDTVHEWINVYRVDDYIGTRVEGGEGFPLNYPTLTAGGHTNYWEDRETLQAMAPYLPGGKPRTTALAA